MHRTTGGFIAGTFFILPSVFLLLVLSYIYAAYANVPGVAGVLYGFRPVVVAIVVEAVLKIGGKGLKRAVHFLIAAIPLVGIYFIGVPFLLTVLAAAVTRLLGAVYLPEAFTASPPKIKEPERKRESHSKSTDVLPLVNP